MVPIPLHVRLVAGMAICLSLLLGGCSSRPTPVAGLNGLDASDPLTVTGERIAAAGTPQLLGWYLLLDNAVETADLRLMHAVDAAAAAVRLGHITPAQEQALMDKLRRRAPGLQAALDKLSEVTPAGRSLVLTPDVLRVAVPRQQQVILGITAATNEMRDYLCGVSSAACQIYHQGPEGVPTAM